MIVSLENCSQTNGDYLISKLGEILLLDTDVSDCDGIVNHYSLRHVLGKTAVCNTLIDIVLEKLPGTDLQKTAVRFAYPRYGIDPNATVVSDVCECTCTGRK